MSTGNFSWNVLLAPVLVGSCIAAIITIYFRNNPLAHTRKFMMRRFVNWFPLGMTYAFLYMGRYNLNVAKGALGTLMSDKEFGWIFFWGTTTYAFSFLVNGPLVDRLGGKRGILIAAGGAALANCLLGVLTYLVLVGQLKMRLVVPLSVLYSLNMYFQSYGAMSIIKVKAYWFHVRERGVFGAVFGTLISIGIYFAFDWGQAIAVAAKAAPVDEPGLLRTLVQKIFATADGKVDAVWAVFFIPAAILVFWLVLDWWLLRDTPEEAGFPAFDTHDASSGKMHIHLSTMDLLRKVFTSPLMLMLAAVEFTSGVLRNGIMQWYLIYAKGVKLPGSEVFTEHWGLFLCIFGIIGGFGGGMMSDHLFHSRRGPPAALLCAFMFVMTIVMACFINTSALMVGSSAVLISMAVIGVHSLMSGTAAADFGGRKATATCSGIVDGFVYLGSGLESVCVGQLTHEGWLSWPLFMMPFALLGGAIAVMFWHELPEATKRYNAEHKKSAPARR